MPPLKPIKDRQEQPCLGCTRAFLPVSKEPRCAPCRVENWKLRRARARKTWIANNPERNSANRRGQERRRAQRLRDEDAAFFASMGRSPVGAPG